MTATPPRAEPDLRAPSVGQHVWQEDVGRCICCWHWCPRCRQCKCQVRSSKATECQEAS